MGKRKWLKSFKVRRKRRNSTAVIIKTVVKYKGFGTLKPFNFCKQLCKYITGNGFYYYLLKYNIRIE